MFNFAKNAHWLQTLAVRFIVGLHPAIGHNVEKIMALKKALYLVNLENVEGDYVEFGMYEGTSFIGAFEAHKSTRQPNSAPRAFWGYDSFEGFKYTTDRDVHPFFREGEFKSSYDFTRRRIERHFKGKVNWTIVPGYVEETIGGKAAREMGIERVAVAFIDVDLGEPARIALDFIGSALQDGSIVVFDDFFAYRGSLERGVAGAFEDFRRRNPEMIFRRIFDYGYGGQGWILAKGGTSGNGNA